MSDPVTNVEIEDVLSSIRRLVSEDVRPRPAPPTPEAPQRLVLTPAQRVTEEPQPDPLKLDSPIIPADDALSATDPAESSADDDAETEIAPREVLAQMVQREVASALQDMTPKPSGAEDSDEAARTDAEPMPVASAPRESRPDPFEMVLRAERKTSEDVAPAPESALDDAVPDVAAPTETESALADQQTDAVASDPFGLDDRDASDSDDAQIVEGADTSDSPEADPAPQETATAVEDRTDHPPQSFVSDGLPKAADDAPADGALSMGDAEPDADDATAADAKAEDVAGTDALDSDIAAPPSEQTEPATGDAPVDDMSQPQPSVAETPLGMDAPKDRALESKIVVLEQMIGRSAAAWETASADAEEAETDPPAAPMPWQDHVADAMEQTDAPSDEDDMVWAAPTFQRSTRIETPPDPVEDAPLIDEDMLRDMVAEIVRQELQGALGERITRNVRKLVRREIHRALLTQDLE